MVESGMGVWSRCRRYLRGFCGLTGTPDDQFIDKLLGKEKKTRGVLYYIVVIWGFFKSQTWRLEEELGDCLAVEKIRLQVAIFVKIPDRSVESSFPYLLDYNDTS